MTIRDFANSTVKELHLYADSTSGDDANSGKSLAQPKKTLEAVLDLVPSVIKHNVAVHLLVCLRYLQLSLLIVISKLAIWSLMEARSLSPLMTTLDQTIQPQQPIRLKLQILARRGLSMNMPGTG